MVAQGKAVKARRIKHNLTQQQVAGWAQVSQRHYSYFEAGRARLAWNTINALNSRFDRLDKGEMVVDLASPVNLLQEDQFLSVQQRMLNDSPTYKNLWLFGVRRLPVLTETAYQDKWVENLNGGISYNVFLVLDEPMDARTLQLFQSAVSGISTRVKAGNTAGHGRIVVHGLTNNGDDANEIKQQFSLLKAHLEKHFKGVAEATGPHLLTSPDFERCRAILLYGWLRSIVFYEDSLDANSFAAVFLENISNDPQCSGDGESGWTFLTRRAVSELHLNIRAFIAQVQKSKNSTHQ